LWVFGTNAVTAEAIHGQADFVIIAISALTAAVVLGITYHIYDEEGIDTAVSWLFGREDELLIDRLEEATGWDLDFLREDPILTRLRDMSPKEFEYFVADLWNEMGWETEVRQQSSDIGVDVIATKDGAVPMKHVIQAKKYSEGNKVGGPDIQQYASLKMQENADAVIVVTTSSFTKPAEDRAEDLGVKLIDGDKLREMYKDHMGESEDEKRKKSNA